jgi:hypothetical protein
MIIVMPRRLQGQIRRALRVEKQPPGLVSQSADCPRVRDNGREDREDMI